MPKHFQFFSLLSSSGVLSLTKSKQLLADAAYLQRQARCANRLDQRCHWLQKAKDLCDEVCQKGDKQCLKQAQTLSATLQQLLQQTYYQQAEAWYHQSLSDDTQMALFHKAINILQRLAAAKDACARAKLDAIRYHIASHLITGQELTNTQQLTFFNELEQRLVQLARKVQFSSQDYHSLFQQPSVVTSTLETKP